MTGGRFAALANPKPAPGGSYRDHGQPANASAAAMQGQIERLAKEKRVATSASDTLRSQVDLLTHENESLKRMIDAQGTSIPTSTAPSGPQGGAGGEAEAALRHENAALKRRMASFEQQLDVLRAGGGSAGGPGAPAAAGGQLEEARGRLSLVQGQLDQAEQGLRAEKARADKAEADLERARGGQQAAEHENNSLKARLGHVDVKLREGEQASARGHKEVQTLQDQIQNLSKALSNKADELRAAQEKAAEAQQGSRGLQDRVSSVSSELHAKSRELEQTKESCKMLAEQNAELKRAGGSSEKEVVRLAPFEEKARKAQSELDSLLMRMQEERENREKLLTESLGYQEEVKRLTEVTTEQTKRVGELEEELGQMHLASHSKDETLSTIAASRYQMHAQLEGREQELNSTKEESMRFNMDLRETIGQLQVAQNRVKTLEKRVRELDSLLSEHQKKEPELIHKDTEIEGLRMQLAGQQIHERHVEQLSELLAEKEGLLADALKKQGAMIEELEIREDEKKKYHREVERLKVQNESYQTSIREMQSNLEEHSNAMAFSEKMLRLSREQTDSLHALRESLREKEEMMTHKDSEIHSLQEIHAAEVEDLRSRLLSTTDANRQLQGQMLELEGMGVERNQYENMHRGYEETRQQLALSHNKAQRTRDKMLKMRNMVVRRIISQWDHACAQAAFNTWLQMAASNQVLGGNVGSYNYGLAQSTMEPQTSYFQKAPSPPEPPREQMPQRPWDRFEKADVSLQHSQQQHQPVQPPIRSSAPPLNAHSGGYHSQPHNYDTPPPPAWSQTMADRPGASEVLL